MDYSVIIIFSCILTAISLITRTLKEKRSDLKDKNHYVLYYVLETVSDAAIIIVSALIALLFSNMSEARGDKKQVKAVIEAAQEESYRELELISEIFDNAGVEAQSRTKEGLLEDELMHDPFYYVQLSGDINTVAMNDIGTADILKSELVMNNADAKLIIDALSYTNKRSVARENLKKHLEEIDTDYEYDCQTYLELYRIACFASYEYNVYQNIINVMDGKDIKEYENLFYLDGCTEPSAIHDLFEPIDTYGDLCGMVLETSLVTNNPETSSQNAIAYYVDCKDNGYENVTGSAVSANKED